MSLVAAIRGMLAKGFSVEQALDAAEAVEAAGASKSARQERNARYYAARRAKAEASEKRLKASETSESDERLKASETVLIKTPLARVEDNKLTQRFTEDYTTQYDVREFADPPTRAEMDWLTAELFTAGSPALNTTTPNLHVIGPMFALLRPSTGPPCDFEADMLAVIRAKSKSQPPGSVNSWKFYRDAILEARDRRLQPNPDVIPLDEHRPHQPSARFAAKQANLARAFAGARGAPQRGGV